MIRKNVLLLCILAFVLGASFLFPGTNVINPDKPLKGQWDFKLKQVWKIDKAGKELFARPRHLVVSGDGLVYLYDIKRLTYYIFSDEGKFLKAFGPRGEGPGEIKTFYNAFRVNDKLIVVDIDRLHYFTKDGTFIKAVINPWGRRRPSYFLNENEFIHFPILVGLPSDIKQKISLFNIKTGAEKILIEFSLFKGGYAFDDDGDITSMAVVGLSPMMVAGYSSDRIYYGFNNSFEIQVADYNGKKLDRFSLERNKKKITRKEKRGFFIENPPPSPVPDDVLDAIIKTLPDELTYFSRIEVHNKLIYIHVSYLTRQPENQQIDIFSPGGKYLYRSFIHAPGGHHIFSGPIPILQIKNNHLYMALEDEEGEILLAKYEINLPSI